MSRKRRFKKIIKGYLNRIGNDGQPHDDVDNVPAGEKKALLATIDAETNTQLLSRFNFSNPGTPTETFDVENDGGTFKNDPAPFDERDFQDTDGDTIGDNEDIILTKIKLDAIFQDVQKTTPGSALAGGPVGTLQDLMNEALAVQQLVNTRYTSIDSDHNTVMDGGAAAITAAKDAIADLRLSGATDHDIGGGTLVSVSADKFTSAGLTALNTEIDRQAALVASIKAEIAAMTADGAGTAAPDADSVAFPGAKYGDYTALGASVDAKTGAANTGAGGIGGSAVLSDLVTAAKARSTGALDSPGGTTSGSIAMLAGIDGA